jgi:hypothetical protein
MSALGELLRRSGATVMLADLFCWATTRQSNCSTSPPHRSGVRRSRRIGEEGRRGGGVCIAPACDTELNRRAHQSAPVLISPAYDRASKSPLGKGSWHPHHQLAEGEPAQHRRRPGLSLMRAAGRGCAILSSLTKPPTSKMWFPEAISQRRIDRPACAGSRSGSLLRPPARSSFRLSRSVWCG